MSSRDRDDDDLDDEGQRDNLEGTAGLRQRGRAELVRLTEIEAAKDAPVPLTGPVKTLGLLRRRLTGGEFFQDLGACAYVVRLDDGAVVGAATGLGGLDDQELVRFSAALSGLQVRVADEQLRRFRDAELAGEVVQ